MKNRKLLLIVSLVLALTMSLGGTLAYLTDTDSDVNVMTLGKVQIEQIELERIDPSESAADNKDNFQEYTQGQMLLPATGTNENGNIPYAADDAGNDVLQQLPYGGAMQLWDDDGGNVMDKLVFVKNTGNTNAYVRTLIAFEGASVGGNSDDLIHHYYNGTFWTEKVIGTIEVEGVKYSLYEYTYTRNDGAGEGVLKAGETTRPSLLQLYMASWADNEDLEQFGETYDILVVSQAVQAAGFDSAEEALNEAFGETTVTSHPWNGTGDVVPELPVITVTNTEELNTAIANLEDNQIILLTAGEYEMAATTVTANNISFIGSGDVVITEPEKNEYVWRFQGDNITLSNLDFKTTYNTGNWTNSITVEGDNFVMKDCTVDGLGTNDQLLVISGSAGDVTISNCDFVGAYRQIGNSYGSEGSTVIIENCTFSGNTSYAVHFDSPYADVIVRNCKIKGHSAIGQTGNGNVSFENCDFLAGDTYNQIALHRSVTFTNCNFSQSFALGMSKGNKTLTFVGGTWDGWDSVKERVLDDSFSYNLTAIFDGDTWAYVTGSGWNDITE